MKKILIVDDDADFLLAYLIRLKHEGYSTSIAQDGKHAISAAEEDRPDLILLDIGMPGKNGMVVLNDLMKDLKTASIPVIVVTGRDPALVKDLTLELGAVAFCQKPVDNNVLLGLIREHTGEDASQPKAE